MKRIKDDILEMGISRVSFFALFDDLFALFLIFFFLAFKGSR